MQPEPLGFGQHMRSARKIGFSIINRRRSLRTWVFSCTYEQNENVSAVLEKALSFLVL